MIEGRTVVGIIPARGGSKGIKGKNIRNLGGKPLIAYSIQSALKSKYIDKVIVSTDNEKISKIAKDYGADVPFIRPNELALDDTPAFPVLKHALDKLEEMFDFKPEIIVWLEPPFPFRKDGEIDQAIEKLHSNPDADSLRSVCKPFQNPFKMWVKDEKGYLIPLINNENENYHTGPRQKTKAVLWQNGHTFLLRRKTVIEKKNLFGDKILPYILDWSRFIDIDEEKDLELAELLLKNDFV